MSDISLSVLPGLHELCIISRIGEYRNTLVIFGCCSEESYTADVDFLNCFSESATGLGDGGSERIEVANDD